MLHFSLILVLFSAIIQSSSSADISFVIQFDKPFASTVNVSTFTNAFNALIKKQIPTSTPTVTIKKFTNSTGNTTTVDTILTFAGEMSYTKVPYYFNGTLNTTFDSFGKILSYSASSLTRTNIAMTVKFNSTFIVDFNNQSSLSYKNFINAFAAFLNEKLTEKPVLIIVTKLTNNSVLVDAILQFIGVVAPESLRPNIIGLNYPVIGTVLEVTSKTANVSKIAVEIYFNKIFDVNLKTESSSQFTIFKTNFGNFLNSKFNNRIQSFGIVSIDSAPKGTLVNANLYIIGDVSIIDVEIILANATTTDIGNVIAVTGSIPTTSSFILIVVFSKPYIEAFKNLNSDESKILINAFISYIKDLLANNKPDSIIINSLNAGSTVVAATINMLGAANPAAVAARVAAAGGDPTLGNVLSANSASGTGTVANSGLKHIFSSDLIKLSISLAFLIIFS